MTVDVRAKVFCNLGTIISGSIADEALSVGQGLISCRGQLVLAGLSTPAVGSVVNIGWQRGSTIARLPRTLRVLSSFANPFTRQTTVQLGDKLVYLANLKGKKAEEEQPEEDGSNGPEPNVYPSDEYDWQAGQQCYLPKEGATPFNFSDPKAASQLTVREAYALAPAKVMNRAPMGIRASSVLQKCCAALGLAFSGTLTNTYQDDFDLSTGYVSVLDQLISSESLFGYLNESETLVLRGWDGAGTGPLLNENSVIELSGINSGVLPGQVVSVTFDSKRLEQTAAEEAQQELDAEEAAQAALDDPTSTEEEQDAAQAELDALAEEKQLRDWERDEAVTYNQEYNFYAVDDDGNTIYELGVAHNPRSVTLTYYDESDYKIKGITTEERIFAGELGSILQARLNVLAQDITPMFTPVELSNLRLIATTPLLFRTEEYLEYVPIKREEVADSLALDPDLLCPDPNGEERVADEDAAQEKRVEKQQVRQTVKRFEPIEALIGKLNISGFDFGDFDLANLPSGEYEAERTVITYDTNQPEGQTKTRTDRYLAYGLTQNGQQDTAEKGQVTTDLNGLNDLLAAAKRLVFEGTSMAIQQDRTFGVQQRPRTEARQEALKEKQAPVGATNDEGRQQAELEQENSTVESKPKTELEMPLASDDAVVWSASDGYEFVGSNAMSQALRYARTQNAVMFGNRAGVSLQVPAYVMPLYPLSSVYLQAAGLTAAYKANGLSWSFNSDGVLGAMDALYAGAVSGSGTFWMPVAPGITSLPSNPTVTTGTGAPANSTSTPGGFDPTAPGAVFASLPTGQAPSYAQSIAPTALVPSVNERVPLVAGTRTALSVTALDYALTLPSASATLETKTSQAVQITTGPAVVIEIVLSLDAEVIAPGEDITVTRTLETNIRPRALSYGDTLAIIGYFNSPYIKVGSVEASTFTTLANPSVLPFRVFGTAISPDGTRLVMSYTQSNQQLHWYSIANNVLTKQGAITDQPYGRGRVRFSNSGQHLLITYSWQSPWHEMFVVVPSGFTKIGTVLDPLPSTAIGEANFSLDDHYIAAVYATVVHLYQRDGATWTGVATANTPSTAYAVAISPDNTMVAAGTGASPYLFLFSFNGTVLTPVTHNMTIPGRVNKVTFSPEGRYIAISHNSGMLVYRRDSASSYTQVYTTTNSGNTHRWGYNDSVLVGWSVAMYAYGINTSTNTVTEKGNIFADGVYDTDSLDIYPKALLRRARPVLTPKTIGITTSMTANSFDPGDVALYDLGNEAPRLGNAMATTYAGWTQLFDGELDDDFVATPITLPFSVTINGVSSSSIYVNSNSAISFGAGDGSIFYYDFPEIAKIMVAVGDYSLQKVYVKSGSDYVIFRWEGYHEYSGYSGTTTVIWEMAIPRPDPVTGDQVIEVRMGDNFALADSWYFYGDLEICDATSSLGNSGGDLSERTSYIATSDSTGASWTIQSGYSLQVI